MSSLRLTTSLQQKMILTPQLRQRIEMLQMTAMELQDLIEQEMVANPILEEVTPGEEIGEISDNILDQNSDGHDDGFETRSPELNGNLEASREGAFDEYETIRADISTENGAEGEQPIETGSSDDGVSDSGDSTDAFEEIDYGREFQEYLDPGYKTQEIEYKEDAPSFEQFLTSKPSLSDHLEWQLSMTDLTDAQERAAIAVIGNLDEDGRLTTDIETIASLGACSIERAEEARQLVMSLEPVGCGAKDVRECLLVQLYAAGYAESLAATLVRDHLEDLQPHRLQHLSKATGIDVHELNEEINKIRVLDPYPGRRYSSDDAVFVAPEVYIEKLEDEYVIYFADDGSPRLRISPSLQNMLSQEDTTRETKDFIKEKMRSAVDLLRNIEHRRQTIYRVVECIVKRQTEFLDKGVEYIKPMMLKDVAEDIGMHLSTISRVVNRK